MLKNKFNNLKLKTMLELQHLKIGCTKIHVKYKHIRKMTKFCDSLHENKIHYTPSWYDYDKTLVIDFNNNQNITEQQLETLSELLLTHCGKVKLEINP